MKKLKTPDLKVKTYPHKVIYFCDPMHTLGIKTDKEEYKKMVAFPLETAGIKFKNVKCTIDSSVLEEMCDVFFFDWGGMSLGNSCLEGFSREIRRLAEDRPNTYYVMTSAFTRQAMEDAIEDFGTDRPVNLFLDLDDFISFFKKMEGSA